MQRKRDGLVPIGDALSDLDGPVPAILEASPQARQGVVREKRACVGKMRLAIVLG